MASVTGPANGPDIYVPTKNGCIVRVVAKTGLEKEKFCSEAGDMSASPVTAGDGTIYLGSLDGYLYAITGSCRHDCGNFGRCNVTTGVCRCMEPYHGSKCDFVCPQNCSGHGKCDIDSKKCKCEAKYLGEACQEKRCKNDCTGRGSCHRSRCNCKWYYEGEDCSGIIYYDRLKVPVTTLLLLLLSFVIYVGFRPAPPGNKRERFKAEYVIMQPEKTLGGLHNFGHFSTNRFERAVRVTSSLVLRQRRPHQAQNNPMT